MLQVLILCIFLKGKNALAKMSEKFNKAVMAQKQARIVNKNV